MNELSGRNVVVIGGTSGIGLATAKQAHTLGANVWAVSRSEDRVKRVANENPGIKFEALDTHDAEGLANLFARVASVDHIVAAATGANRTIAPFMEQTAEQFSEAFDKFWGYCNVIRQGVPFLTEKGSVTLVSGTPARKCNPGMSSLSCVGSSVEALTRALAAEIAPRRVNVVAPGIINTGMFDHFGDNKPAAFEQMAKSSLLKRVGESDEVASAIILTLTNDYITGITIDVDGGQLLP